MRELFAGSGVAIVTPFGADGIHETCLRELIDFQIREGTDALVINGSTGEAAVMTPGERRRAVEVAVGAADGRIPVIAGVGGSDTAAVARLARQARDAGAGGLLASAPPYNKPSQSGLVAHYRAILDAADLPLVIYNVPSRTACNILPETIETLVDDERVVGVKEASGDISQIAELARRVGDRVPLYSGNDDQVMPVLALGGRGVVSVLANVAPADTSRLVHAFLDGRIDEARQLQLRYLPLIRALFLESNPIGVKAAVEMLGYAVGEVRLPLLPASRETRKRLAEEMRRVGIELRED